MAYKEINSYTDKDLEIIMQSKDAENILRKMLAIRTPEDRIYFQANVVMNARNLDL